MHPHLLWRQWIAPCSPSLVGWGRSTLQFPVWAHSILSQPTIHLGLQVCHDIRRKLRFSVYTCLSFPKPSSFCWNRETRFLSLCPWLSWNSLCSSQSWLQTQRFTYLSSSAWTKGVPPAHLAPNQVVYWNQTWSSLLCTCRISVHMTSSFHSVNIQNLEIKAPKFNVLPTCQQLKCKTKS